MDDLPTWLQKLIKPSSRLEARSIVELGATLVAFPVGIWYVAAHSRRSISFISFVTPLLITSVIIGLVVAIYGIGWLLLFVRRSKLFKLPNLARRYFQEVDYSPLPKTEASKTSTPRLAAGIGLVIGGLALLLIVIPYAVGPQADIVGTVAILIFGLLFEGLGIYLLYSYFKRRRLEPKPAIDYFEQFLQRNTFSIQPDNFRQALRTNLEGTRYVHNSLFTGPTPINVTAGLRPAFGGTFMQTPFYIGTFYVRDVIFGAIILAYPGPMLAQIQRDAIVDELSLSSSQISGIVFGPNAVVVVLRYGLAFDQVHTIVYFQILEYLNNALTRSV